MMRGGIKQAVAAFMLIGASQAQAVASLKGTLSLVCSGTSETTEYANEEHVMSQEGDVRLYLSDMGGTAEIPRFIGGGKDGRQVVRFFTVTDAMITGKINYQQIGNAKMRIDRIAGTISITGPRGNFSGRCRPFDAADAVPKF